MPSLGLPLNRIDHYPCVSQLPGQHLDVDSACRTPLLACMLEWKGSQCSRSLHTFKMLKDVRLVLQQLRTSEGLEAMLEQVGATLAPGKQQALQVSRDHGKHAIEDGSRAGAPIRVSNSCLDKTQA